MPVSHEYRLSSDILTEYSGRFFARRSVNAVVAILLSRYDLEIVSDKFPEMDGASPSPDITPVMRGQNVEVKCTP